MLVLTIRFLQKILRFFGKEAGVNESYGVVSFKEMQNIVISLYEISKTSLF